MGAGAKGLYRGGRAGGQGGSEWFKRAYKEAGGGKDASVGQNLKAGYKGLKAGALGVPAGIASASGKASWEYAKKHINSVRGYLGGRSIDT